MASGKGTITFVNIGLYNAFIYTVDDYGGESFVVNLPPQQSSKQNTDEGQTWTVKASHGDQLQPLRGGRVQIRIIDADGQEVKTVTGDADDQTYQIEILHIRLGGTVGGPESAGSGGG